MSDYQWCHGPKCHTNHTQDRIRGVQGSKVLRTRKISQSNEYIRNSFFSHFCSQGCWNDFAYAHWEEFIRLHPRTEALETPINVVKEKRTNWAGNPYTETIIQKVDNA